MSDITMCQGGPCPKKEECYRYKAEVNPYRQAYFIHIPYIPGMGCEMYQRYEAPKESNESK